jgi:carboxylesterase type B
MKQYWTNFANRGFPSSLTGPPWPRFDSASHRVLSLISPQPHVETDPPPNISARSGQPSGRDDHAASGQRR